MFNVVHRDLKDRFPGPFIDGGAGHRCIADCGGTHDVTIFETIYPASDFSQVAS